MIVALIGEELGLIGLFAVVMLYMLLFTRGSALLLARGTRSANSWLVACPLP